MPRRDPSMPRAGACAWHGPLLAACWRRPGGAEPSGGASRRRRSGGDPPIEITADRLVLEQDQQMATFTGNVDAVQGETRLRADQLRVFYTRQRGSGQASGDQQSIRRIEAEGNVRASPSRARPRPGNSGVYDLTPRKMVLRATSC